MTKSEFLSRLSPPTSRGCIEWTGASKDRNGYGHVRWNGKNELTHRVAWQIAKGYEKKHLRHECDNPSCCNVAHLIPGTQAQNMADCKARGRGRGKPRFGESNHLAKLTRESVEEIRRRAGSETYKSLGEEFGVTRQNIRCIVNRLTWNNYENK